MKLYEKAKNLADAFDALQNEKGEFLRTIIKSDHPLYDEAVDLTFKVSEATSLDSDSVYEFTERCLDVITSCEAETLDDAYGAISDLQPDTYTSDLTAWLGRSCHNVYYLSEAIELGAKDGFEALSSAQWCALREVGDIVVDYLSK